MPIIVPAPIQKSIPRSPQSGSNNGQISPQVPQQTVNQEPSKPYQYHQAQLMSHLQPSVKTVAPQSSPTLPQNTNSGSPIVIQSRPASPAPQQLVLASNPTQPSGYSIQQSPQKIPQPTFQPLPQTQHQPPSSQPAGSQLNQQLPVAELQKDNAALQRKILEVAGLLDRERETAGQLRLKLGQLEETNSKLDYLQKECSYPKEYMKLKSLEPEFLRLQKSEQDLKHLLSQSQGRLAESEGMHKRMEADFLGRKTALETQLGRLQQEVQGLRAAIASKDGDISRLRSEQIDPAKLKGFENEVARLRIFEREALELRPLRNEIVRLKVIENDYWRLKGLESEVGRLRGLESEVNRLKGIESAFESTRIRLSQAESEISRINLLQSEKLKMLSAPSPSLPEMPSQDLRDSSPMLQAQLNTSAVLSDMHNSLKDELSALGSLSTLILAKLNELSTKPITITSAPNPSKVVLAPLASEGNSLSEKILDNQKEMESRLKHIEQIVTQMGGTEGRTSEAARFDDVIRLRLALEKSLDGLRTNDIEDVRLSNPELFSKLQEQFAVGSARNVQTCEKQTEVDFAPSQTEVEKMRTEINKLVMERRRADDDYHRLEADFDSLRQENQHKEEQVKSLSENVQGLQRKLQSYLQNKAETEFLGFDSANPQNPQGAQTPALGMFNSGKGSESNGVSDENKINDLIKYFSQVESERGFKAVQAPATPSSSDDPVFRIPPQSPAFAELDTNYNTGSAHRELARDKQTPRTAATKDSGNDRSPAEEENMFAPARARRVQGSINPMLVRKNEPTEAGSGEWAEEPQQMGASRHEDEEGDGVSPVFGKGNRGIGIDRASFGIGFKGFMDDITHQNALSAGNGANLGNTPIIQTIQEFGI